jgi:YHS domain-containing protein
MEVDNSSEFKAGYQGKTYYFCNQQDKQEFQQHPGKYVKESSTNTSESK